jgi:hypothetical protein
MGGKNQMRATVVVVALALALPAAASAQQSPNVGQMLQGLMTGNQGQDQALRDAFERGYQRGREDEARRADRSTGRHDDDRPRSTSRRDDDRPYPSNDRDQPYPSNR